MLGCANQQPTRKQQEISHVSIVDGNNSCKAPWDTSTHLSRMLSPHEPVPIHLLIQLLCLLCSRHLFLGAAWETLPRIQIHGEVSLKRNVQRRPVVDWWATIVGAPVTQKANGTGTINTDHGQKQSKMSECRG